MIDKLLQIDQEIFLYLNGKHTPWLDSPFFIFTHTLTWTPLFLVLLYMIVKDHRKKSWIFLIGLTVAITFADQFTSTFMKPYFERLRPTHDPALAGLVHTVKNYVGGKHGFASSHAANTFATATFLFILLGRTRRWMWLLFVWAAFICYTRIYLGVHYPGDLVAGGLIGSLAGWAMAKLCLFISQKLPVDRIKHGSHDV
jgi:undecaprenyl-diphosphatase